MTAPDLIALLSDILDDDDATPAAEAPAAPADPVPIAASTDAPAGEVVPIESARKRGEHTMKERLSGELMDAVNGRGQAVKKREDTHRMADANRAFSHYRW